MSARNNKKQDIEQRLKLFIGRNKTSVLLLILTFILFIIPFAYLLVKYGQIPSLGDLLYYFEDKATSTIQLFYGVIQGFSYSIVGAFWIFLLIIGASLLFDVKWKKKTIWKRKSSLHVYLGYYITLELTFPIFVWDFLASGWHVRLWSSQASILLAFLVMLSFSIFGARILSKLPIRLVETNLGSFIMAIYISHAFFAVMSKGFNFLAFWKEILHTDLVASYLNALFILSSPAIFALFLTMIDSFIIKRVKEHGEE